MKIKDIIVLPSLSEIHKRRKWLRHENTKWPAKPVRLPAEEWPGAAIRNRIAVWRSSSFVIQAFKESPGLVRLSICRSEIDDSGNWRADISWDDLQSLKDDCGFASKDAVEIYPASEDVVNVANMRHLWVFEEPLSFAWRDRKQQQNQTKETEQNANAG